jgi:hypothetical protein
MIFEGLSSCEYIISKVIMLESATIRRMKENLTTRTLENLRSTCS